MLATCLAQGGEFAFVVLNVAMSEHVITQAILEPINLIVTLSMILTPDSVLADEFVGGASIRERGLHLSMMRFLNSITR